MQTAINKIIAQHVESTVGKYQDLKNQGCKCQLCQKIIFEENMKIILHSHIDQQSQQYNSSKSQEKYLNIINQISTWNYKRGLRFSLPELCVYQHGHPVCLIEKKKESNRINLIKSKSRLHFFEIQNFFLNGYLMHCPVKKHKTSKNQAQNKAYLNQCIVFAKYKNNTFRMLTYNQIQNLFRSKNKSMKDGLLYLQTVVGGDSFQISNIKIDLDDIQVNLDLMQLWNRAKSQTRMMINQIKMTDQQFIYEADEIKFQNQLKQKDINHYLVYLSYKIILVSSKRNPEIMKKSIFKYNIVNGKVFLFDLIVESMAPTQNYWSTSVLKALEIKLQRTMSMMQLDSDNPEKKQFQSNNLSNKAKQLSQWLTKSTKDQWNQMRVIRQRLQRLQEQKKSLQKSKLQQTMKKSFKIRNMKRRQKQSKVEISLNF